MASRSEVSICNQALGWLGANLITSFEDQSKESNLCEANYSHLRDSVLEDSIWTFATVRTQLPSLATPELGYGVAYQLPDDCLRVDQVFGDSNMRDSDAMDYVIEDRKILSDEETCFIRYTKREEDVVRYSPNFTQALAYRIATELAIPLTKSRTMQQQMQAMYMARLDEATATDSMQTPSRKITVPWMNNARF